MPPTTNVGRDDRRRSRDRGVSATVGFVLVLGFLLITFTFYQGIVVPEQNRHVEFDHSLSVQSQMVDLRNAIRSASTGTERSVSIEPGASYPIRILATNLGVSTGEVRTASADSGILIENATALDEETTDYFGDGSTSIGPLETASIRYEPNYLWYTNAPTTVYENSIAFNRFDDGTTVAVSDQSVVDGRRITLIAVNGTLSEARSGTVSVDVDGVSTSTERIAVTNTSGGKLNITIPSELSAAEWEDLLDDEMSASPNDGRYVEAVKDTGDGTVSLILEGGVTYDLRLAKVGVGATAAEEDPHYVTDVTGNGTNIAEGGSQQLEVEVRDRFNNPVSNVTVESTLETSAGSGDGVSPVASTTDSDGRATFTYRSPDDVDGNRDAEITVFFDSKLPGRQNVTFDLTVLDADGSGGGCSGPGTGSTSTWCAGSNTTVSQPGGVVEGIGSASHINISDPTFSSVDPTNGEIDDQVERFRLVFVLERDQADRRGTTRYLFAVPNKKEGFNENIENAGTSVNEREVIIYKDASYNDDGNEYEEFVTHDLKQSDLNNWYNGDQVIDLLDPSHYSGNPSTELTEIRDFIQNNEARIHVVDMHGRVELSIE